MCRAVTCKTCGKTTWAGCGQHVDQVMRNVAKADRCAGHQGEPRRSLFSRFAAEVADEHRGDPVARNSREHVSSMSTTAIPLHAGQMAHRAGLHHPKRVAHQPAGGGTVTRRRSRPDKSPTSQGPADEAARQPTATSQSRRDTYCAYVEPEIPLLLRVGHALTGSWCEAESLVQRTLSECVATLDELDNGRPRVWLMRGMHIVEWNSHRRHTSWPATSEDDPHQSTGNAFLFADNSTGFTAESPIELSVQHAVAALEPHLRSTLLLIGMYQLSCAEASAALGKPVNTILTYLSTARDQVRPALHTNLTGQDQQAGPIQNRWNCRWSAHRIQRYIDADPAARLDVSDANRLRIHLVMCAKCLTATEEHRALARELLRISIHHPPAKSVITRVRRTAEEELLQDTG